MVTLCGGLLVCRSRYEHASCVLEEFGPHEVLQDFKWVRRERRLRQQIACAAVPATIVMVDWCRLLIILMLRVPLVQDTHLKQSLL